MQCVHKYGVVGFGIVLWLICRKEDFVVLLVQLGVCLKTARCLRLPQYAAKCPFLRNSYVLWHVLYVNVWMKAD